MQRRLCEKADPPHESDGQSGFSSKLREHGIAAHPARGAALIALLEDVPPPILADTLGLHIGTTVHWAAIAQRDWTAYLAARDIESAPPDGNPPT